MLEETSEDIWFGPVVSEKPLSTGSTRIVFVTELPFQDVDLGGEAGLGDPLFLPSAMEREVSLPGFKS